MASTLSWTDLQFEERLGEGQAGEVWRARLCRPFREHRAGEPVAVKRYKRWLLDQPGQLERIYRELAVGMKVEHPNIVRAYCLVTDPHQGTPCLVMRYYEGITLERLLQQRRDSGEALAIEDAFRLLRGIAAGVKALHDAGALHRDVKPANIIVGRTGSPVLMDLGVVTETILPEHTQTERFLGTIRYAHPKYLTGLLCNSEADTYSVGAIAYELFFQDRFLGDEGNWASLVAKIVSWQSPSSDDISRRCKRTETYQGRQIAEAVYWTLRTTLRTPKHTSLSHLCTAIDREFWKGDFYDTSEGVEIGIPWSTYWDPSEEFPWPKGSVETWSLSDVIRYLLKPLDEASIDALRRFVGTHYWHWQCRLDDGQMSHDEMTESEADLNHFYQILVDDQHGGVETVVKDLEPFIRGLLRLYRYDLVVCVDDEEDGEFDS